MNRKQTAAETKRKTERDRYTIHSVDKALDVIEILSDHEPLGLLELAELVNQPKSSLYRIVFTLEKRGFIEKNEEDGKYRLGFKQLTLTKNLLARNDLRSAALEDMNRIVDKYADTVNLCVLSAGEVVYMEIIEGSYALRMSDQVGSRAPFHATAAGKAIVAFLPEVEVKRLLQRRGLPAITEHTITDEAAFLEELARIRERGYAVDNQESTLGARCVAAPIFNMFGKVEAAISLSGAQHRFPDENIPAIAADMIAAAGNISAKRGYRPNG